LSGRRVLVGLAGLALVTAGWTAASRLSRPVPVPSVERTELGLFTSLPILWSEVPDMAAMLDSRDRPHWAKAALERRFRLHPLDTLDAPGALRLIVMAQPRALLPPENVALDDWVRGGGRLLIFADPMLTFDSAYPVGDRRRPQDIALLSPILARWGLELRFDEAQPGGWRESAGRGLPVNLAGTLALIPGGHEARCTIGDGGLVARCGIGAGRALIVADAALMEPREDRDGGKARMLDGLLDEARSD
jgi:hypothetical protein